jgi:hypothetical protein
MAPLAWVLRFAQDDKLFVELAWGSWLPTEAALRAGTAEGGCPHMNQ